LLYRLLAGALVAFHLGFVLFVVLGGLLVLRFPRAAWLHLPAAVWGTWVEVTDTVCPLTPLENHFRRLGGEAGYSGGFIEHYLLPVLYPAGLTRGVQYVLAGVVVGVNLFAYGWALRRRRSRGRAGIRA
jgi:uncharacterized protein DUF2784